MLSNCFSIISLAWTKLDFNNYLRKRSSLSLICYNTEKKILIQISIQEKLAKSSTKSLAEQGTLLLYVSQTPSPFSNTVKNHSSGLSVPVYSPQLLWFKRLLVRTWNLITLHVMKASSRCTIVVRVVMGGVI